MPLSDLAPSGPDGPFSAAEVQEIGAVLEQLRAAGGKRSSSFRFKALKLTFSMLRAVPDVWVDARSEQDGELRRELSTVVQGGPLQRGANVRCTPGAR